MPSRTVARLAAETGTVETGVAWALLTTWPVDDLTWLTIVGWSRVPPLASELTYMAWISGEVRSADWPMPMVSVSPGFQRQSVAPDCRHSAAFQASSGTSPAPAPGISKIGARP